MHFPHTVAVLHGTETTDAHGNLELDWSDPDRDENVPAWVQQRSSSEGHEPGRAPVTVIEIAFLPLAYTNDADAVVPVTIGERDRLEFDGAVFAVDGRPVTATTPRGPHHLEAALRRIIG